VGICIASTQPFRAALGAKRRVCYLGNTADRHTQSVLKYCHLSQNSKSERGVDSLPPLRFEPITIGMLVHLSDRSAVPSLLQLKITISCVRGPENHVR
jgi:hypothetical protein